MVALKRGFEVTKRSVATEQITGEEAAKILHVSLVFLKSLIAQGRLTGVRSVRGGHYRIPRAAVLSLKMEMKRAQS